MQAEVHIDADRFVAELTERISGVADEGAARSAYRTGFNQLRALASLHPDPGSRPSAIFESAASTARMLAARCLPLGIAVTMHLYPLCALQCMPLPRLSVARFQRALLLQTIRARSLILANAGSERTRGVSRPLVATPSGDGVRIDGTCEYMSLASVADIVFFEAKLTDRDCVAVCAADLEGESVRIGSWKFSGRMRMSDTSSATFVGHRVPRGRYLIAPNDDGLRCVADYQRCWFHLFLADINLARIEHLQRIWGTLPSYELLTRLDEVSRLRADSLTVLDSFSSKGDIGSLMKVTSALKLRVSLLAQSTVAALRHRAASTAADAERLAADAAELCCIKSQPTADEKIMRSFGWLNAAHGRDVITSGPVRSAQPV